MPVFVLIITGRHEGMTLELVIISCSLIAAFCGGYMCGSIDIKRMQEAKQIDAAIRNHLLDSMFKEEERLEHLSRQSLAFSQKQKHWIKVYDAEAIE